MTTQGPKLVNEGYEPEEGDNSGGDTGSTTSERLTRLETLLRAVATREDLSNMEVGMRKWGIGIFASSIALVLAMAKFF